MQRGVTIWGVAREVSFEPRQKRDLCARIKIADFPADLVAYDDLGAWLGLGSGLGLGLGVGVGVG